MLTALSIRDIVLIEHLDLRLNAGLTGLTGETGAGKSILLDALGLAVGGRGDAALVRAGAAQGSAAAVFDLADDHPVRAVLGEAGLSHEGDVILRRVQTADGRTRAFVNDQPVSVSLLRQLGDRLVEVHGQHETHGLLDPQTHRVLLDAFGGLEVRVRALSDVHADWRRCQTEAHQLEAEIERSRVDADYLRASVEELATLAPLSGEEADLAGERNLMMNAEKIAADLAEALAALEADGGIESRLAAALGKLERRRGDAAGHLDAATAALDRVVVEAGEARDQATRALESLDFDPGRLEEVESRLFALRAAARKHGCDVDDLPGVAERLAARLTDIDGGDGALAAARKAEEAARTRYTENAKALSAARIEAAGRLDLAVATELPPLKLDKARFRTEIETSPFDEGGPFGIDRVRFEVATNPGAPFAGLSRIASGGELARFMLALKVSLAARGGAPVLVFDEVDAGVGGAVAEAVGQRLAQLAATVQVLVVTHSPQVAARAHHHMRIEKRAPRKGGSDLPATHVEPLQADDRREEIARMLAGATVTAEARAAAERLIEASE